MIEIAAKIPFRYLKEFELEPRFIYPGDVFPYGIIIQDLLKEANPEQVGRLEQVGMTAMLLPTKKAMGPEEFGIRQVELPVEVLRKFEVDPMVVFPGDVFPYGIILPDVWLANAGRAGMAAEFRDRGWAAVLVPTG